MYVWSIFPKILSRHILATSNFMSHHRLLLCFSYWENPSSLKISMTAFIVWNVFPHFWFQVTRGDSPQNPALENLIQPTTTNKQTKNVPYLRDRVVVDVDDLVEVACDYYGNLLQRLKVKRLVRQDKPREGEGRKVTYSHLDWEIRNGMYINQCFLK